MCGCDDQGQKDPKLSLKDGRLFGIWQGLGQDKKMLIGAETFNQIKKGENPLQDDLAAEYTRRLTHDTAI